MHIYIYDVAIELVSRDVCSLSPYIIYIYNNICMFVSVCVCGGGGGVYRRYRVGLPRDMPEARITSRRFYIYIKYMLLYIYIIYLYVILIIIIVCYIYIYYLFICYINYYYCVCVCVYTYVYDLFLYVYVFRELPQGLPSLLFHSTPKKNLSLFFLPCIP